MSARAGALRWHVHADGTAVAAALCEEIAAQANRALAERGAYLIVLPGGSTPQPLYAALRGLGTDWGRWHVYFTDERCVPRDDPRRNDAMARSVWLDFVPLTAAQVHSIPAELGPEAGAEAYRRTLQGVGRFDTALLGLGEDGHTASLFPGRQWGEGADAPDALAVHAAPKPPAERVTLSARRLADARRVALLATGAAKRGAVARLHRRDPAIPAAAVVPPHGADVWLDADAAADIRSILSIR